VPEESCANKAEQDIRKNTENIFVNKFTMMMIYCLKLISIEIEMQDLFHRLYRE